MDEELLARLTSVYRDLHRHPELSSQEHRTAGIVAAWLRDLGLEVIEGVGGTGVVGVLRNGPGPTVALRADMDALPVAEETGLPYSSTVDGVMHACGHDVHVTCLLGAATTLDAVRDTWRGTLVLLFQPAEETVSGAQAMVDDDLFSRVPRPDVVLGQHVAPIPAGVLGLRGAERRDEGQHHPRPGRAAPQRAQLRRDGALAPAGRDQPRGAGRVRRVGGPAPA